jgi:hypothetical protein
MSRMIMTVTTILGATVVVLAWTFGSPLVAQTTLAQLGLTETAARTFVLDEIKAPTLNRTSRIALAGTGAFLKLPASMRAAAATGLFAWAKAYVNSPAFKTAYDGLRRDRIPSGRQYSMTIDEAVKKDIDDMLQGIAQIRATVPSLPPAQQPMILEKLREQEAMLKSSEFIAQRRAHFEAERGATASSDADATRRVDDALPANPQALFARRLREFLDATTDVNFSARTISLNGSPDGIVFLERADRKRHWIWQLAVIAGPEATGAARAAAQGWLQEIER